MVPTSNENEMEKVKMYAVIDGEYREVMELQGEITLSEDDEIVRCRDCIYWEPATLSSGNCGRALEITAYKDDFCSYGERRSDEAD